MAYKDLREWINVLEAEGELKRIKAEVDWNLELGAIARVNLALGGPALLFENIMDHKDTGCRKVFTGGMGTWERMALVLGFPKNTPQAKLIKHCAKKFKERVKPMILNTGPVKENILKGEEVNLYELPVPKWHHLDGGRFIDTFGGVITRDPDTGWVNVGIYRGMIVGKNKIAKLIVSAQHWGQVFTKYREKGQPMPVAIAYGWDDLMPFVASAPVPRNVCEWDIIGALRGEPVPLVKCETVDLEVPASAEIVVEGTIDPNPETFEMEGPFGEWTGWYGGGSSQKPVLTVNCLTYRNDAIFRGSLEGIRPGSPNEDSHFFPISLSAVAWNILEDAGVPGVTDVYLPGMVGGTNIYVQIHKMYRGHAQQVAHALWGSGSAQWFYKNVIVVEEDIDIHNPEEIEWALAYRVNAGENDIVIAPRTFGSVLDPSTRREERDAVRYGSGQWYRVLIDATRNWNYKRWEEWDNNVYPPVNKLSIETEKVVARRWKEYGLGIDYLTEEQREKLTMEKMMKILPIVGKE